MKSITIHGIDDPLAELIKSKARSEGLSVNKTVKKLLEEALGVKPQSKGKHRSEFEEFCGIWSDSDLNEFQEKTKDLRTIHQEEWTAEIFGMVKNSLSKSGTPIPINDVWIASHAIETGTAIITFDNHFKKVAGLRLWDGI